MAVFGLRKFLKSQVKNALGLEQDNRDANGSPSVKVSNTPYSEAKRETEEQEASKEEVVKTETAASTQTDDTAKAIAPQEPTVEPKEEQEVQEAPKAQAPQETMEGQALTLEAVQEILDDMVRPALQGDGGDITLIKIENDNIHVKLVGACSTCPSSVMTMKMGVEALLRAEFPTMNDLVEVDSQA